MKEKSQGVPSWCEQLLREMYDSKKLLIVPRTEKMNLPVIDESTLTRRRQTRRASVCPAKVKEL